MNVGVGANKCAIISLESKRNLSFDEISDLTSFLAANGCYCSKISRVDFSASDEILKALADGADNYQNIFVLCPVSMSKAVSGFFSERLSGGFDGLNILQTDEKTVFLINTDGENRLRKQDIKAVLEKKYRIRYDSSVIRTVGATGERIAAAMDSVNGIINENDLARDIFVNLNDSFGDCKIEIVYSERVPKILLDDIQRAIVTSLNEFVYAMEDVTLAEQLLRLLKLRRLKISVAESFTGGGVCKRIVEVSGASEVFFEGLNTYSNQAKMSRLGVKEQTLARHGAVSAETACEMAEGLLKSGSCNLAIATTGIAGPKSDDTKKPVGLAYIAVGLEDDVAVYRFEFKGDRRTVTETAINHALFLAYKRLK